jgi:hypothetical protein
VDRKVGIAYFGAILVWELLSHWGTFDFLLARLRETGGPGGEMIAAILASSGLRMALILLGLVLVMRRSSQVPPTASAPQSPTNTVNQTPEDVLGLTPEEVLGWYEQHTSFQADRLLDPYRGKLMRIEGIVTDVRSRDFNGSVTIFTDALSLEFPKRQAIAVSHIKRGERIAALGRIRQAGRGHIMLKDCRLTSG